MPVQKGRVRNPAGKGGFGERPWDINRKGTWDSRESYSYQLHRYVRMTAAELDAEAKRDDLTTAQMLALTAIQDAMKLEGAARIAAIEKLANRTDGMPRQTIDQNVSTATPPRILVEFPDGERKEE